MCESCYARARRANPILKERQYAANRKWLASHPEYEKLRSKRRWKENPNPLKKASAKWRIANPDKTKQYKANWKKNNPEKYLISMRAYVKKRKSIKRGASISDFTASQWEKLKQEYHFSCRYCGCTPTVLTQDHKLPLSRGGNHTLDNIVPACGYCNGSKGTKTLEEYINHVEA